MRLAQAWADMPEKRHKSGLQPLVSSRIPTRAVGPGFYETAVCVKVFALRFSFLGKFLLLLLLLFVLGRFSRLIPLGLLYALEESREGLGA